jgi:hypothetical protein
VTTVADVAAETGRPTTEVLEACRTLGIVASGPASGLSSDEHRRLREALGAGELPDVPRGSTTERPRPAERREVADPPSPPKPRLSARTATRIGLAVFLVVAVVVAVVSLRSDGSRQGAEVGTCVDLAAGGPAEVPCGEPHDAEVVGVHDLPDGGYPGDAAVRRAAEGPCATAIAERVDPDRRAGLEPVLLVPTAATWAGGDRTVTCLVEDPDGPLVGSVAGSER